MLHVFGCCTSPWYIYCPASQRRLKAVSKRLSSNQFHKKPSGRWFDSSYVAITWPLVFTSTLNYWFVIFSIANTWDILTSMVGVWTSFPSNVPSFIPRQAFNISEHPHEFRDSHGRMGVIQLNCYLSQRKKTYNMSLNINVPNFTRGKYTILYYPVHIC